MADKTESSITINASPAAIMAVIADLEQYPEWSDGVNSFDVLTRFDDGRPETARMNFDAGVFKDECDLVYQWDGNKRVEWHLTKGKMLKELNGIYILDAIGDTTKVTYQLEVDLSIPMLGMMKRKAEKAIVDTALKGLKKRVES